MKTLSENGKPRKWEGSKAEDSENGRFWKRVVLELGSWKWEGLEKGEGHEFTRAAGSRIGVAL